MLHERMTQSLSLRQELLSFAAVEHLIHEGERITLDTEIVLDGALREIADGNAQAKLRIQDGCEPKV